MLEGETPRKDARSATTAEAMAACSVGPVTRSVCMPRRRTRRWKEGLGEIDGVRDCEDDGGGEAGDDDGEDVKGDEAAESEGEEAGVAVAVPEVELVDVYTRGVKRERQRLTERRC